MTIPEPLGLPPIDIAPRDWADVVRILHEQVPDTEVWAFGSRAKRNPKPYSDLDLALITRQPLSLDQLPASPTRSPSRTWRSGLIWWIGHLQATHFASSFNKIKWLCNMHALDADTRYLKQGGCSLRRTRQIFKSDYRGN